MKEMKQHFTNMEDNPLLSLSTLLDHRFKKLGFALCRQGVQRLTTEVASVVEEQLTCTTSSAMPHVHTGTGL